jgi:hypothetical protein
MKRSIITALFTTILLLINSNVFSAKYDKQLIAKLNWFTSNLMYTEVETMNGDIRKTGSYQLLVDDAGYLYIYSSTGPDKFVRKVSPTGTEIWCTKDFSDVCELVSQDQAFFDYLGNIYAVSLVPEKGRYVMINCSNGQVSNCTDIPLDGKLDGKFVEAREKYHESFYNALEYKIVMIGEKNYGLFKESENEKIKVNFPLDEDEQIILDDTSEVIKVDASGFRYCLLFSRKPGKKVRLKIVKLRPDFTVCESLTLEEDSYLTDLGIRADCQIFVTEKGEIYQLVPKTDALYAYLWRPKQ